MLRRAAQSLRQACTFPSSTLWNDFEIASSKQRIHSQISLRHAAEEAVPSPTPNPPTQPSSGLASVPTVIKLLGFGGIIPFWAFSPVVANNLPLDLLGDVIAQNPGMMQIGYGATIISFLGGVHWGLAMTSLTPLKLTGQRYIWSVMPCLTAWPTLVMPVGQAAGTQAALLGLVYLVDRGWFKKGGLPPWYMAMRLPLTIGAAAGLAMTAVGAEV